MLKNLSFDVEKGDWVAIQGRSGSGKSTLFHLAGSLLKPDSGEIFFEGKELTRLSEEDLAHFRNKKIGFIFQQFHLLARANVLENILLPTLYPLEFGDHRIQNLEKARELAASVGLQDKLNSFPNQLSGGEQQRVVIARALMTDAPLLLADEPTGNLDSENASRILDLLEKLNRSGKTILLITHDPEVAKRCKVTYLMQDGKLSYQSKDPVPLESIPKPFPTYSPSSSSFSKTWKLIRNSLPLAIENLRWNKTRAGLTLIGVSIGIAAVFSMVTFGKFAQSKILEGYNDLGVNSLLIYGHDNWKRKSTEPVDVIFHGFSWEKEIRELSRVFHNVKFVSPLLESWENSVNYGGQSIEKEVNAIGVSAEARQITNRGLTLGRPLTPYHIDNRSPVCLIGTEIRERLFKSRSPLGQIIFITNQDKSAFPCEVIGVLEPKTTNKDWRKPNLEIVMPFTYFQSVYGFWYSHIHQFLASLTPGSNIEYTGRAIQGYFQQKYGKSALFAVNSDDLLLAQMQRFIRLFSFLLMTIALVTLGVGGMGINNMMLVSLAERFKEIGLRKALGATGKSVRTQFLLESMLLCGIAGLIGVTLGFSLYEIAIYLTSKLVPKIQFEWIFEPAAFLISFFSISLVGVLSGIVPAIKAERLQVIEALRSE